MVRPIANPTQAADVHSPSRLAHSLFVLTGVTPLRLAPRHLFTTADLSLSVGLLSLAFLFWVRRRATDGDQVLAWCVYLLPAFLAAMILALQGLGAGLPMLFFDSYSVEVLAGALVPVLPAQPAALAALWAAAVGVFYWVAEVSFARVNAPSPERR